MLPVGSKRCEASVSDLKVDFKKAVNLFADEAMLASLDTLPYYAINSLHLASTLPTSLFRASCLLTADGAALDVLSLPMSVFPCISSSPPVRS